MKPASKTAIAVILAFAPGFAAAQNRLDPIAEVGDPTGIPGTTFAGIAGVYVHPSGRVAVDGRITGAGVTVANDAGLWRGTAGALSPAAREGGPETFNSMTPAGLTPTGGLFFRSTEANTGEGGLYFNNGALTTVGRTGFAAPLSALQNFTGFGNFSANDVGQISIFGRLSGSITQDTSLYTNIGGSFEPAALESGPVAGIPAHTFLDINRGGFLALNDQNYLAGYLAYTGPGRVGNRAGGLLLRDPGTQTWSAIINRGDAAAVPGGGAGIRFDNFSSVSMNNAGQTLFAATLQQVLPVNTDNNTGVWRWQTGDAAPSPVAREGDPAAGLPGGVDYDIFEELFLSNAGLEVLVGRVRGAGITLANDRVVWETTGLGLAPILREGETVLQGSTGGIAPGPVQAIESLGMDIDGVLILQASVGGQRGVWKRDPGGQWVPVLTPGECVQDSNFDSQKVVSVRVSKSFPFNLPQGGGPVGRLRTFHGDKAALLVEHSGGSGAYFVVSGAIPLEALAIGGMEAPGIPGSRWHKIDEGSVINSDDKVDFRASLAIGPGGVTAANDHGIWAQRADGSIGLIAREGGLAPGAQAGALFSSFPHTPAWNDAFQLAFYANMLVSPPITAQTSVGLWRGTEGSLELIAQSGIANAPLLAELPADVPIGSFFGLPILLQDGSIYARAFLQHGNYANRVGPGLHVVSAANDGILLRFTTAPTVATVIARESAPIAGDTLSAIEQNSQLFESNTGPLLVFSATVSGPTRKGIYVYNGTTINRYAIAGDMVPSTGGLTIQDPGHPIMAESGVIALRSLLSDGSSAITVGLHSAGIGSAVLVARTGIPQSAGTFGPVGIHPDATWSTLSDPGISDDSALVFQAKLTAGVGGVVLNNNDEGLWRIKGSTLALVARAGNPPTNELGQVDPPVPFWKTFFPPRIASLGRLAYTAGLTNGRFGWWTMDAQDVIRDMVRTNDLLTVPNADTVTRDVVALSLVYGNSNVISPNGPSPYRSIGTLKSVIMINFNDAPLSADRTSGLFVADIPAGGGGNVNCDCCAPPPPPPNPNP